MATILNKRDDVLAQLNAENKAFVMNSMEDLANLLAIDQHMEEVNRDYQIKDQQSQLSAASVILTS